MSLISAQEFGLALRLIGRPLLGSPLPAGLQRQAVSALLGLMPGAPVQRRSREIAGVKALELVPADARPGATILYFHGGGYVVGSASGHAPMLSHLAAAARARVISLDYRLAPEHPFPAAVTDATAVYGALLDDGQDPGQLVLGGDSAGGGLALATLAIAREDGRPGPGRLVLISPWVDLRLSATRDGRGDALLRRRGLDRWADAYCAGHPRTDPQVSPILASLSGLAPTLVQYDAAEILAGQAVAFIAAARAAGVSVTAQPFSGFWHDFQLFTLLPGARVALRMAGEFAAEA